MPYVHVSVGGGSPDAVHRRETLLSTKTFFDCLGVVTLGGTVNNKANANTDSKQLHHFSSYMGSILPRVDMTASLSSAPAVLFAFPPVAPMDSTSANRYDSDQIFPVELHVLIL